MLVLMNRTERINIELQIINFKDWLNRSLAYLCRQFDHVSRGGSYNDIQPVHHISLIDFPLFTDHEEFHGTYMLKNVLDGYVYNSNFLLSVVELNRIKIATEADIASGLVDWVKMFKSTTWEEIKMLAEKNEFIASASDSVVKYTGDEMVRKRIQDREDSVSGVAAQCSKG